MSEHFDEGNKNIFLRISTLNIIVEMWWLIGSAPDFCGGGPGFEFGISHNDPGAL